MIFLEMLLCVIVMSMIVLSCACQNEYDKVYIMRIHYDVDDIVSVNLRKGGASNATSLKLSNGTAEVRMSEMDLKGVGQITIIFRSKKHGDIEYVDGPVSVGRYLYVNCYNGRIVIKVINTGYM